MSAYQVLVYSRNISPAGEHIQSFFNAELTSNLSQINDFLLEKEYRAVVVDVVLEESHELDTCREIIQLDSMKNIPLVVLTSRCAIEDKLKAFEYGCDDLIDDRVEQDEVCARVTKSIFNKIAHNQLSKRLELATDTALSAMVDNSDLGANIQFLLSVHDCDNLDQLGQQFFATIERYGLSCSLQMRSAMGVKDMEAHGMAKDLESQLLMQLKDDDRFIDFGQRTILNYDRVSVLIKNMPLDDAEKYGAIKDNTFCLVQGLNARIIALEDRHKLLVEKNSLQKLSGDIQGVVGVLNSTYDGITRQILVEVENAVEMIQNRLPLLALTENDEAFIEGVLDQLISETNSIFSEGIKVDEVFSQVEKRIHCSLNSQTDPMMQANMAAMKNRSQGNGSNSANLL